METSRICRRHERSQSMSLLSSLVLGRLETAQRALVDCLKRHGREQRWGPISKLNRAVTSELCNLLQPYQEKSQEKSVKDAKRAAFANCTARSKTQRSTRRGSACNTRASVCI